jgi:hypothetical protein
MGSGGDGGNIGGAGGTGGGGTGGARDGSAGGAGGMGGAGGGADASAMGGRGPADAGAGGMPGTIAQCTRLLGGSGPSSQWVSVGPNGKLVYKPFDARGDRIIDFSFAGYMGGGVALPDVPVVMTLGPSGGDDDAPAIQAAINAVSQRPLVNGFRGAVLLRAGTYHSLTSLAIVASGVVLRGSGSGADGTVFQMSGANHRFIDIKGSRDLTEDPTRVRITDDYVPAGASSFTVENASSFKVGDAVTIARPVTAAWVHFVGMDTLVRNGMPQTWLAPGTAQRWERTITAIAGNKVTIDIPLSDSFDAQYVNPPGGSMGKYSFPGRVSQSGVESLRVETPPRSATQSYDLITIDTAIDCWAKDLRCNNCTNAVRFSDRAKRVTGVEIHLTHDPITYQTSAAPADFTITGQQNLLLRSSSRGGLNNFYITTMKMPGPNAVLDFAASGSGSEVQPHMRWGTGLLVDRAVLDMGPIEYRNRNSAGSGHGWAMAWGVAWNSTAQQIRMDQPPGVTNWAIGCKGSMTGMPPGTFDSHGTPVFPSSLYLAQLCERLGPQALANIGYR